MERWQKEVGEIIKKQFPDDDSSDLVKEATKLLEIPVEPPSGELGKVVAELMRQASKELNPLAAVYVGFQFGVAWERHNKEGENAR